MNIHEADLFDGNGDTYGVDGALDEDSLFLVATDHNWSQ